MRDEKLVRFYRLFFIFSGRAIKIIEKRLDSGHDYRVYHSLIAEIQAIILGKEKKKMALRKGEVYRCPDANCGCEITVTKGAPETCKGQEQPRCCCGKTMEKVSG